MFASAIVATAAEADASKAALTFLLFHVYGLEDVPPGAMPLADLPNQRTIACRSWRAPSSWYPAGNLSLYCGPHSCAGRAIEP